MEQQTSTNTNTNTITNNCTNSNVNPVDPNDIEYMKSMNELTEIWNKLQEYKQSLSQIESLIERENEKSHLPSIDNSKKQDRLNNLFKLQKDLKDTILFQEDLYRFRYKICDYIFNDQILSKQEVGKICYAYFEGEGKWFTAMINEINLEQGSAEITWLGYKEKCQVPFKYIKVNEPVLSSELSIGMQVEAIYFEDGMWYNSTVEMISEHGVHVKYNKYNDVEVVSFDSIRITPEQRLENNKKKELELQKNLKKDKNEDLTFKFPEHLRVTSADDEQQRLLKRKRVKGLKNQHKQKVIEKISKEKQDSWMEFNQKANKNKALGSINPIKKKDK
jgi:hypothetical protein